MRRFLLIALVLTLVPLAALSGHSAAVAGGRSGILYVPVPDDSPLGSTEIAVQVFYPSNYVDGQKYPALVEIEGYGGAASPNDGTFVNKPDYVVVGISVRGTGCSAGQLELFSDRSSQDGAWIIDHWITQQSWYDHDKGVGIYGHSYGGLHGFLLAEQHPAELRATAVSGLIDDFYRGILYPGGVNNYGFPILWGALNRPLSEHSSNASYLSDPHCAANYAQHLTSDSVPPPAITLDTYGSPFTKNAATGEDAWAITQGLMRHIDGITTPIQLGQQYQDEQTGPRGGHVLWENIPAGIEKRIQISTGMHNPNDPKNNKRDWLDCFILRQGDINASATSGKPCSEVRDPAKRVLLYFESKGSDRLNPYIASDWPLPASDATWTRYFLRSDGTLTTTRGGDGEVSYVSTGNSRHMTADFGKSVSAPGVNDSLNPYGFTTGLPDTARYTLNFTQTTAIAGPIDLTLYAKLSSPDTNFWAEILDRDSVTGATTFVQRGLLRAAAAAGFEPSKSQKTPDGDIYRPYYDYTADTFAPVVPATVNKYEVEVFPLGHVWRAGHQLVLQLHAPPASDPISIYSWQPTTPGVVTIVQDADHPTSILFPIMNTLPPMRATAPACGEIVGELCITPVLG